MSRLRKRIEKPDTRPTFALNCGNVLCEEPRSIRLGGIVKSCYVSIPFGRKADPVTGRMADYDLIYTRVIRPAVEASGLNCVRADELELGTFVMKSVFSAILSSDIMIADVSFANPNVMYELGLRHGLRRGVTLLIMSRDSRLPYNISDVRVIPYVLNREGGIDPEAAIAFQKTLGYAIKERLDRVANDTPCITSSPT